MQNDTVVNLCGDISALAWRDWAGRRQLAVFTAGRRADWFPGSPEYEGVLTFRMRRSSSQNFEENGRGLLKVLHLCSEKPRKTQVRTTNRPKELREIHKNILGGKLEDPSVDGKVISLKRVLDPPGS